mmetsp:Transcript_8424/g.12451  ORF Transcript_8424/g.12451 Transcript_8424/m.12451 type:complete len:235 (+) Transcript_8424:58-762(+)
MSYNGIGLQTARGSGTNAYIRRNLANVRDQSSSNYQYKETFNKGPKSIKGPNKEILSHEKQLEIENKLLCSELHWEDEGVPREEIDRRLKELREDLTEDLNYENSKQHTRHYEKWKADKERKEFRHAPRGTDSMAFKDAHHRKNERFAKAMGVDTTTFRPGSSFENIGKVQEQPVDAGTKRKFSETTLEKEDESSDSSSSSSDSSDSSSSSSSDSSRQKRYRKVASSKLKRQKV